MVLVFKMGGGIVVGGGGVARVLPSTRAQGTNSRFEGVRYSQNRNFH